MNKNEDFPYIYEKYKKFSVKVVFRIVKNMSVAEDISQEVMIKLFQMGERLDTSNEKKLHSLVFTMSTNKAKDYFRKREVKREYNYVGLDERKESNGFQPDPLELLLKMEKTEHQSLILERFREKKPDHYDILIKVTVCNIPPASVAEEYGVSVNVINNRVLRARRWLLKEMSKSYET